MKIVIFGATGSVGKLLVEQCLTANHTITAFARKPEALQAFANRITIVQGDLLNLSSVEEAVEGQDVVLSTFGGSNPNDGDIYPKGITNIISAMKKQGVQRIVCLTSAAVDDSPELTFFFRRILKPLLLQKLYKGMKQLEILLMQSDLDWTIVGPGAFTNGPRTGVYRTGDSIPKGGTKVSRADVADLFFKEATDTQHIHKKLIQVY